MPLISSHKLTVGTVLAGVLIATGLAASPGLAQQPDPAVAGHGPKAGPRGHEDHLAQMCTDMDAHEAAMLAFAEVKLKITDAQKPVWAQFADKAKAAAAPLHQLCQDHAGKPTPKTLPERLALMEEVDKARLAHLTQLTAAVTQIYGQLTPEQKEIADHTLERGPEGFDRPMMDFHPHGPGGGDHPMPPPPAPDHQ